MNKTVIFRGLFEDKPVIIYYDSIINRPVLECINLRNEKKVEYLIILDINSFLKHIPTCYYFNADYIKPIDNKYCYIYN